MDTLHLRDKEMESVSSGRKETVIFLNHADFHMMKFHYVIMMDTAEMPNADSTIQKLALCHQVDLLLLLF